MEIPQISNYNMIVNRSDISRPKCVSFDQVRELSIHLYAKSRGMSRLHNLYLAYLNQNSRNINKDDKALHLLQLMVQTNFFLSCSCSNKSCLKESGRLEIFCVTSKVQSQLYLLLPNLSSSKLVYIYTCTCTLSFSLAFCLSSNFVSSH